MFRKKSAGSMVKGSHSCIPARVAMLALLSVAPQRTWAETIVSSLSNSTQTVAFSAGHWAASPFTTGYKSFQLTNVTVSLLQGGTSNSLANVRLYSDNNGQPGVSLADLGVKEITGFQSQLWSFAAPTDIELASHTTYWIAVGNVSTDQGLGVNVVLSAPFSYTGSGAATMAFSGTTGIGSGLNPPATFDPPGEGAALPFQADGTATSVPEPGPFAVLILGGVTFLASQRLRRPSAT
jgi:hypothetical protein